MYILGVDGGATTSKCVLSDEHGSLKGSGQGGPSDHLLSEVGRRRLRRALEEVLAPAVAGLGLRGPLEVESACLGMTGVYSPETSALVEATIKSIIRCRHVQVYNDMVIALAGAAALGPGLIVYAGTGSHAYGIDEQGKSVSVGGWGYIIDDAGAGYDLGRQVLRAAFRASAGLAERTSLIEKVKDYYGKDSLERVREEVYKGEGPDRPRIAGLAKVAAEAAAEGDPVAQQILKEAAEELARLAWAGLRKLEKAEAPFPVYPAGGIFKAGEPLLGPFRAALAQLAPRAVLRSPAFPPVIGALLLAMRKVGLTPDERVLENIRGSLGRLGLL